MTVDELVAAATTADDEFAGLGLRALHDCGFEPAVLVAVSRAILHEHR